MVTFDKAKKVFPNFTLLTFALALDRLLAGCDSVLDLGCGKNSPLRILEKKKLSVGVDAYAPYIRRSRKKKIHDKYYIMDVLQINERFKPKSFDAVLALDLIEHLQKSDGKKLLSKMEKIARKKVVILTPNGFIKQEDDETRLQEHLSGWTIGDFKKKGYKIEGMYGLKFLRGEKAELRFRPKFFWGAISELTHYLYTKNNPKYSFSLLCYKNIE